MPSRPEESSSAVSTADDSFAAYKTAVESSAAVVSAVCSFSAVYTDYSSPNLPQIDGNMPIIVDPDPPDSDDDPHLFLDDVNVFNTINCKNAM